MVFNLEKQRNVQNEEEIVQNEEEILKTILRGQSPSFFLFGMRKRLFVL